MSWVVDTDGRRLLVKTAGPDGPPAPGAPAPYFDQAERVRLLRNAITLAHSCDHPALAPLLNVIESAGRPLARVRRYPRQERARATESARRPINDMGRMFGSSKVMAPEEFELGAPIDQHTTVFTLGRLVWHFATRLTEGAEDFCGPPALADAVAWATSPDRSARPRTVTEFAAAWRQARSLGFA